MSKDKEKLFLACLNDGEKEFNAGKMASAEILFLKAFSIARQLKDNKKVATVFPYYTKLLNSRGEYRKALRLSEDMLQIGKETRDSSLIAVAYGNIGNEYISLGDFNQAAKYTLIALRLTQKSGNLKKQRTYSNNLASIFIELREVAKSLFYAKQGYDLAVKTGDSSGIAGSLVNLANAETLNKNYSKATFYYNKLVALGFQLKDLSYVLDAYINLANVSTEQNDFKTSEKYYRKAENLLREYPSTDYSLYVIWGLAECFHLQKKDRQAESYLKRSIAIATSTGSANQLKLIYLLASDIYESLNQPQQALRFRKEYDTLKDSVSGTEARTAVNRLEIEYQTAEKEKSLAQQQLAITKSKLELAKKDRYILIFLLAIIVLVITSSAIYVFYRMKRNSDLEKLKLMEKEKEVETLEAMITGEEKERARLARELHDGVGGILSASRMHLSILTKEFPDLARSHQFVKTSSMLDSVSGEIRSIAHNLAPYALVKEGLDRTLENFCRKVNSNDLKVTYYSLGDISRYKVNFELFIYRLVQECLNNIMKHAKAKTTLVQLSVNQEILSISIEDDGIGFDPQASAGKGLGLSNLKSRVTTMGGILDIQSSPSQGTQVYMELDCSAYKVSNTSQNNRKINHSDLVYN